MAVTLERAWIKNKNDISCIPEGVYCCEVIGEVIIVKDVTGRTGINMEIGNTISDTKGCILVGSSYGNNSIMDSRKAFDRLIDYIGDQKCFLLEIVSRHMK